MPRPLTINLDTDWLWRVLLKHIGTAGLAIIATTGNWLVATFQLWLSSLHRFARRYLGVSATDNQRGVFARTWQIGATAMWIAVLLSAYVLVYFVS